MMPSLTTATFKLRFLTTNAKAGATAAGTDIAKYEQLRLMTIDDLAKVTDADAKAALSAEIKQYEADIKALGL